MKFPTATLSLLMITSIAVALPERFSSISPAWADPPSASLHQELQKGKNDPSYISSHQLLENTKQAIDQTNNMGLSHNDANPGNVMVAKDYGILVGYGKATKSTSNSDPLKDHRDMVKSLNQMKNQGLIPLSRMDSYKDAVSNYQGQIYRAGGKVVH